MMRHSSAISPAAVRWNRDFVSALSAQGHVIHSLYHLPERSWPYGRAIVRGLPSLTAADLVCPSRWVCYINVPRLRGLSLSLGYKQAFKQIAESFKPDLVVTFNFYQQNICVGTYAREIGVRWVNIFADMDRMVMADGAIDLIARRASGHVILSWAAYEEVGWSPKIHLDGGVRSTMQLASRQSLTVVYTGVLSDVGGVGLLADAFRLIKRRDVRLIVCGKGSDPVFMKLVNEDSRVDFRGLVSEQELMQVCGEATCFVNPRPSSLLENKYNFPSKVLEYLSYGKPVISTFTPGLSPEYRHVLEVPEAETPQALASCIEHVLNQSPEWRAARREQILDWVNSSKLWSSNAERFVKWVESLPVGLV